MLNGAIADRRGLPQDALFASVRDGVPCEVTFDVIARIGARAPELVRALYGTIESERRDLAVPVPELDASRNCWTRTVRAS